MYIPEKYRMEDRGRIRAFLEQHAFGILVSEGPDGPLATHLPLELVAGHSGPWALEGHLAKANSQWQHLRDGQPVLCIFNGPHAYVSSSWYGEEEVPTWNYQAVHLRGIYRRQSEAELMASLHRLVDKYERDSEQPVSLHQLSPATLRQVKGIVGFCIEAVQVEAAYKLSQGRETDHARITAELEKRGGLSAAVARAMKEQPGI